jgi:uncharacterized membrane protein (GlpM family)
MGEGDTLINALLGAVATAILSGFVPLAPVLGGVIAGYLEGGNRDDGLRVGAISGVIPLLLAIPIAAIGLFVFGGAFLGIQAPASVSLFAIALIVVGFVFGLLYFIGLSAVGGWLGNYVKHDTNIGN